MLEKKITITSPDDFHLHLREGEMMKAVLPYSSAVFARALIMPNLNKPIENTSMALAYRNKIAKAVPQGHSFNPLMALYLTEKTSAKEIEWAKRSDFILGVKYYPSGVTTHAHLGIRKVEKVFSVFEAMEKEGLPLMVHGEMPGEGIDVFDLERVFIDRILGPIIRRFKGLKVTLEHITTQEAIEFVEANSPQVAGSITAHHLLLNRNDLLLRNLYPHHYCLPIVKHEKHRKALVKAATSGKKCFFLGTDSAPHSIDKKESACGCAGIFSAPVAMPLYAQIFEKEGRLDFLEAFSSENGALFYGLSKNKTKISLLKKRQRVRDLIIYGKGKATRESVRPFRYGESVEWRVC